MQWIKHMTDMVDDPKIRRLIRRHGALGYAVYNLAIERIGKRLTTDHVVPDLEETSEDIADLLREDTVKVEESMLTAMQLGLFEQDEVTGRLLCSKVYKFLEQSQTSSKKLRKMITDYRGKVMTRHGDIMMDHDDISDPMIKSEETRLEQNRTEEKRIEKKSRANARHPTLDVPMTQKRYDSLVAKYGAERVDDAIEARIDWEASKGKRTSADYAHAAANWLRNDEKWDGNGSNPDFVAWDPDEYDRKKEAEREQSQRHG